MKSIINILIFCFLCISSFSQKYIPVDESSKDPSLQLFVSKLKEAIEKRDKNFIFNVVDEKIKNSFGGEDGIEEFKITWGIDSPDSELWPLLNKIIGLGGVFIGSKTENSRYQFVFPYVFSLDLGGDIDYFSVLVAISDNVPLKEKPESISETLKIINYEAVLITESAQIVPKGWSYVTTRDDSISGYVSSDFLYSPIAYRMFLGKIDGEWKITSLIEGD